LGLGRAVEHMDRRRFFARLANSLAASYNLEADEILNEAVARSYEIEHKYRKNSEAKFHSWLYVSVKNYLIHWCRKQTRTVQAPEEFWHSVADLRHDPERICIFRETINRLSEDARTILTILFNSPDEILAAATAKHTGIKVRVARGELARRSELPPGRTWGALREIRQAVKYL